MVKQVPKNANENPLFQEGQLPAHTDSRGHSEMIVVTIAGTFWMVVSLSFTLSVVHRVQTLLFPPVHMRPSRRLMASPDRDGVRLPPRKRFVSIRECTNGPAHRLHHMSLLSSKNSLRGYALALPYTSYVFSSTATCANGPMQRETIFPHLRTPS